MPPGSRVEVKIEAHMDQQSKFKTGKHAQGPPSVTGVTGSGPPGRPERDWRDWLPPLGLPSPLQKLPKGDPNQL